MRKNWKKALGGIALGVGMFAFVSNAAEAETYTVESPGKQVSIQFWLEEGVPYYRVESGGAVLIEDAKLGLRTSIGDWKDGFTLEEAAASEYHGEWNPLVGEQETIQDAYHQTAFTLRQENGTELGIVMRAYDEGAAFCYQLPQVLEGQEAYTIYDEYTQFTFPAGTMASIHRDQNQTVPVKTAVEKFPANTMQRPMTLQYADGKLLTICEGNLDNYGVMVLQRDASKERTVKACYTSYKPSHLNETKGPNITVRGDGPYTTPWRVMVVADSETELMAHASLVMNLNEAPDEETYQFSEWLEAGSCLRAATGMNTTAIKNIVDQAQENQFRYVLLDTGWYGPEYDVNCDPRLDPKKLDPDVPSDKILLDQYFSTEGGYDGKGEGVFNTRGIGFDVYKDLGTRGSFNTDVDIPEICRYANERNIGIILYVNGVYFPDSSGRNRFTTDELFGYFEKWGVKGVKPGFVHVRAQEYERYMEHVIACAAKHKLVMTIHDEYVTTGIERTYPNLMQVEGILGDEGIGKQDPQIPEDIATLFTRTIQGPADHTFCYPGKGTKAYALASPILFRAGMSVLYWYTNPNGVPAQDKGKMDLWKGMPTNWKKSLYLEGKMYAYATVARKSREDTWYVGSLSAIERTLEVPLDFLEEDGWYVADIYADGADADARAGWNSSAKAAQTLENKKYLVKRDTVLERNLKYGYGYAVKLTKATETEIEAYPVYNPCRERLQEELEEANTYQKDHYTEESWEAFCEAREAAKQLMDAQEVSDEQYTEALKVLKQAREQLCSTEALIAVLKKAERYLPYHYTAESWKQLEDAVAAANALLERDFYQNELDEAVEAIAYMLREGLQKDPLAVLKNTTYLSEVDYDRTKSVCGPNNSRPQNIRKDKNRAGSTLTLRVDGENREFERGMGADAPADLYFQIDGMGFEIFQSYVGVDAAKTNMGDITFRVYGDGELLYESRPSGTGANNAQFFSIPIAGVKELRLEADMNATDQGDWADWADAKFLTYENPNVCLEGISVEGVPIEGFSPYQSDYFYLIEAAGRIPQVEATPAAGAVYTVKPAEKIPGSTEILVSKKDGGTMVYRVFFVRTKESDYLSDLPDNKIIKNTLYSKTVYRDKSVKGDKIALTGADGSSEMKFEKGIGTHASATTDSMVIYDISGQKYDRFEGYTGIRYATHQEEVNGASHTGVPRSKINFKIYVDDEDTPRFESGPMESRTPAAYFNVDIRGAQTLKLVVDACGDQSADHGNWGGARFLKYQGLEEMEKAGKLDEKILAVEEVTFEQKELLESIRAEYESLSDLEKSFVKQLERLELLENQWRMLDAKQQAQDAAKAAEAAKDAAEAAQQRANEAENNAQNAKRRAEEAKEAAEKAREAAEAAKEQTAEDQMLAAQAQADAQAAKEAAVTAKQDAIEAASQAETARNAAEAAKNQAETAEAAARAAKAEAEKAKEDAAAAQTKAREAKEEAEAAREGAVSARNQAETAKEAARKAEEAAGAQKELAEAARSGAETARDEAVRAAKEAKEAQKKAEEAQTKAEEILEKARQEAQKELEQAAETLRKAQKEAEERQLEAEKALKEARKAQRDWKLYVKKEIFQSVRPMLGKAKSSKKKKAKITWEKVKDAEGYEISYAQKPSLKGAKKVTVKGGAATGRLLKKLKSKKTYYVRIRAYRSVEGEKIYTGYSAKKKVKVK